MQRIRDTVKGTQGAAVPVLAKGSIQSLTRNPSTVSTGQRSLNEPEQPINNN